LVDHLGYWYSGSSGLLPNKVLDFAKCGHK
jgi:hypothetical protein